MNPMTDMFDFNKNFEQFSKMMPDFANAGPMKAFTDMQAKYRAVAIEALNKNVELTTAWMTDAAKDATTLMTPETQPTAYAKKAGELAQAAAKGTAIVGGIAGFQGGHQGAHRASFLTEVDRGGRPCRTAGPCWRARCSRRSRGAPGANPGRETPPPNGC